MGDPQHPTRTFYFADSLDDGFGFLDHGTKIAIQEDAVTVRPAYPPSGTALRSQSLVMRAEP